ncbi:non-ribosomal peptide synthetase/type I polyketide synthase [Polyangium jinanense]|uniref:Amino acid adenylation domain-containing protein n=1 Tax=Polyangium jinanense TaxID=2829994 RepID=A0A9X3X8Y7_9BACT|nr:non-ribosomal peptide synthetase/type I polyketide synthase [Polyangium jinanense]MDC3985907.1 amino acid adenylation domain-containing protein [Polyangium jinanense]
MDVAGTGMEIAIVGLAGRFPGARDVPTFWRNLCNGVESFRTFTEEELLARGVSPELVRDPSYVRATAMVEDVSHFDAAFFGYPPRQAELLDPQQRIFLECAWEALEDAGYIVPRKDLLVGVFGGAALSTYLLLHIWSNPAVLASLDPLQVSLSNGNSFLTTRVSYKLDLKGPSFLVESACSTSLVAVHIACQSLLNEECDVALAGGVSINLSQQHGYRFVPGSILSPDGHCRPFDSKAQGIVFGSGAGVVALRRLEDAIAAGDHIYAVIKGSAVNNDGGLRAGYTAPGVEGQAQVIAEAHANADVSADTISYVETHGTGTPIGDPIEVQALTKAFRESTDERRFCAIGSVKANVGHLDAAAGVASLIKTACALRYKKIPASLHCATPNPAIDWDGSPFFVNTTLSPWSGPTPLRAGVSSFGMGGTNAHAVLEEPPSRLAGSPGRPAELLVLSAKTETALRAARERLAQHLEDNPDLVLADVAHTLQVGRRVFPHRSFVVAGSAAEATRRLRDIHVALEEQPSERPVAFLFPGQGAQAVQMFAQVYRHELVFRRELDRCAEILRPLLEADLRAILYPPEGEEARAADRLNETAWTQPAMFSVMYALAQLWGSWGITPQCMIGHSVGEYVAACLAGVFDLRDALRLVAQRGKLVQRLPPGAMLAVPLAEDAIAPFLGGDVALAAVNAPNQCVLSGPIPAITEIEQRLASTGVEARRLATSHAFHSPMMRPIVGELSALVRAARPRPGKTPFISCVTGTWITPEQAQDPVYWTEHLLRTVRFAEGLATLLEDGRRVLLEVGPGRTLSRLARRIPAGQGRVIEPSLAQEEQRSEEEALHVTLGRLWQAGVVVDWAGYRGQERRLRVPLPTYPFERKRFWIEPAVATAMAAPVDAPQRPAPGAEELADRGRDEAPGPPMETRVGFRNAYVAPESEIESKLVQIWEQILGTTNIGLDDDFLDLGGDSLLATQVTSRIRATFGVDIPVRVLFEAPTVGSFAARLAEARSEAHRPVLPAASTATRPYSFAQQRIWFIDQLEPDSPAYNMPYALELSGRLSVEAMRGAFESLVRRHDVLRTTFDSHEGLPVLRLHPPGPLALPVVDLSSWPVATRQTEANRLMSEEAQRAFNLHTGPLLRMFLIKLEDELHVLVFNMHHIVSDEWTLLLVVREVAAHYNAIVNAGAPELPPLPIQYADYAAWHRDYMQSEAMERALRYWKKQLHGLTPLDLPTDRPRPPRSSLRGDWVEIELPAPVTAGLQALAREAGVTLFMVLVAGFFSLLHRLSGQTDVALGTPVACRNREDFEHLVGVFYNMLVLRADFRDDLTFLSLLSQIKETTLGAITHQEIPFEKLVDELKPARDFSRPPLFEVFFALQNKPFENVTIEGLSVSARPITSGTSKLDLSLYLGESNGVLRGRIEYAVDLFDRPTVERLAARLCSMYEAIVRDPRVRVADLPLLTDAEREELRQCSTTTAPPLLARSLPEAFAAQVERMPDAVALVADDHRITYRDLAARARTLAQRLQRSGVGPDVLVALFVERSVEMMIAILAVLQAGGAYVPIDPISPRERTAFILEDVRARVLLTTASLRAELPDVRAEVLCLDMEGDAIAGEDTAPLREGVGPDNLAYVIYTSGSTGKPKGVGVTHRNVLSLFAAAGELFRFGADDVWTLFHSYAFDFSVWEIWGPLLHGGRLVIVPHLEARSPEDFHALLQRERVTVLNQTPSAFRQFVAWESENAAAPLALRYVVFGGEALDFAHLAPWFARHGDEAPMLVNMYGITETTVHVTFQRVRARDATFGRSLVGRPIPGWQVHVLDRYRQLVPPGVAGEIYVGGAGLARTYMGRPALTATRFVPDPFSSEPGLRLYRSGDLARWAPGGVLEYLGRIDEQVKVRGYRIELGEIANTLETHPGVRDAVVVVREDIPGDKRLVAYWIPAAEPPSPAEIREHLLRTLPEYMIPAAFVALEAIPLTPNGKLDRKALPAPHAQGTAHADATGKAEVRVERAVAAIFAEVLGVSSVGLDDDFFSLGGQPPLVTRVLSRIRDTLGVSLPLRDALQSMTVSALARSVERLSPAGGATNADAAPEALDLEEGEL